MRVSALGDGDGGPIPQQSVLDGNRVRGTIDAESPCTVNPARTPIFVSKPGLFRSHPDTFVTGYGDSARTPPSQGPLVVWDPFLTVPSHSFDVGILPKTPSIFFVY